MPFISIEGQILSYSELPYLRKVYPMVIAEEKQNIDVRNKSVPQQGTVETAFFSKKTTKESSEKGERQV